MDFFIWWQWKWSLIGTVSLREDQESSSSFYPLTNFPFTVAVAGLYGCASLIVMSTKGVWLSHIWESLAFFEYSSSPAVQQAYFEASVINVLGPGDGTSELPGLQQFMGEGGAFGPDMHVQAVLIGPRDRKTPVKGVFLYADKMLQIARKVTQMFGGDWDAGDNGNLSAPITFVDYAPQSSEYSQKMSAAGKAIFQYDPVQGRCINRYTGEPAQFAQQRLWFEDRTKPVADYFWPIWPEQFVPDTGTGSESGSGLYSAGETPGCLDSRCPTVALSLMLGCYREYGDWSCRSDRRPRWAQWPRTWKHDGI